VVEEDVRRVVFHFDFVSPYSWLALMQAEAFGRRHGVEWVLRPVVYAALLDASGLVGPAETSSKRNYTFHDVYRCAHRLGLRFEGPPAHPFRSIEVLRVACLFQDEPAVLSLAVQLADACWGGGRPLTEPGVLEEVTAAVGFDAQDLERRISRPEIKGLLRENTEKAVGQGVFGVPSFLFGGQLFWGHDRLSHLADCLVGKGPDDFVEARRTLDRPRGADRRRRS